jgi:transposase-like protein
MSPHSTRATAVDKDGQNRRFFHTLRRDCAAEAVLRRAIHNCGLSEKRTIDQSSGNTAAIVYYNRTHKTAIVIRQSKCRNNLVEQDHRAVKLVVRSTLGFKSFWSARCPIAGIEVMHAICKGQLVNSKEIGRTPADRFYALAA